MAAARAAPPASSRPFPQPGPSPLSPSSVASLRGILSPAAGRAHLGPLSGAPEEEVGSLHRLDSLTALGGRSSNHSVPPQHGRGETQRRARMAILTSVALQQVKRLHATPVQTQATR